MALRRGLAAAAWLLALLSGCSGIETRIDANLGRPPAALRSWAFEQPVSEDLSPEDRFVEDSLRVAVSREFRALGLERKTPSEADFLVAAGSRIRSEVRQSDPNFVQDAARRIELGLIEVELRDAEAFEAFCRGSAEQDLRVAASPYAGNAAGWYDTGLSLIHISEPTRPY